MRDTEIRMPLEIERKFLVQGDEWREQAAASKAIAQGYLRADSEASVRIRIVDGNKALLTVKTGKGVSRGEFEYRIPLEDAREMMKACNGDVIEKTRYTVRHGGFDWEVDVYNGKLKGLVVAEVELESEDDDPDLPGWLGEEVTHDGRWSNAALATQGMPSR